MYLYDMLVNASHHHHQDRWFMGLYQDFKSLNGTKRGRAKK